VGKIRFEFAAAILILFFISCGSQDKTANNKLTYWSSNNQYEIEFARAVVNDWNQLHPDRTVHTQPVPEGQSSEEVILAAVVGSTTPDIYSNMWQGDVEAYARADKLIPLDTLPGFLEFMYERCDSAVVAEVTSTDGHIYQIPWKINPIMLLANEKQMREIGFATAPATYSEYIEAGGKFQRDTDGDGYVDRWIGYRNVEVTWWQRLFDFYSLYLAASGGAPLIKDDRVAFDNDYAIQTLAFLQTLYKKKYFALERLDARQDAFLSGIIATRFTGPWEIPHAERFKPEGFEYEFYPMVVPDNHEGEIYTYGDPKNIVIFNTCKYPRRAWQFLKFLISKENDLHLLTISNQLPRRKNLFEDTLFADYFRNNPKMIPFAKQAKYVKGTDPCPVLKEVFDIISREYEACVIYNVKSPEQAIKDAALAVQLLLM
jgi:multiple sugar transport system substrate-binding protein